MRFLEGMVTVYVGCQGVTESQILHTVKKKGKLFNMLVLSQEFSDLLTQLNRAASCVQVGGIPDEAKQFMNIMKDVVWLLVMNNSIAIILKNFITHNVVAAIGSTTPSMSVLSNAMMP